MLYEKENPKRDGIVIKQLKSNNLLFPRVLLVEMSFRLLLHLLKGTIAVKVATIRFHLEISKHVSCDCIPRDDIDSEGMVCLHLLHWY
jgi:hypothetical protein